MGTNWATLVEKDQRETYTLPSGWDSRETCAEQMKCSPERAGQLLRPLVNAGKVETQTFPVFDALTKRLVRVVAYRRIEAKAPVALSVAKADIKNHDTEKLREMKAGGMSYRQMGEVLGITASQARERIRYPRR